MNNKLLIGCGGLLLVAVVLAVVIGGWAASVRNELVVLDEQMKEKWAQVETVLQRRYDLIPNLVNTVKGYAQHEKEIFENVARLRSQWSSATTLAEKTKAANEMESALSRLIAVAENYPDLKANQNFRDLQFELSGTENRIAVERQRYNESVKTYNTRVRMFPTSLIAGMMGFLPSTAYFDATPAATEAPKVDFSK
jgi:LemA protein